MVNVDMENSNDDSARFDSFGLNADLLEGIHINGFETSTPIQQVSLHHYPGLYS